MLYLFDDIESFTDRELSSALALLPPQRRALALSYRYVKDRKLSAIAYLLLKEALRREYGIERDIRIETEGNGKPYFPDMPHIHFNLSHCSKAVACAVSETRIGVDVECYDSYQENLAREVLSSEEVERVLGGDREKEFARLWTIKESFLKYTGEGLTDDIKSIMERARDVAFTTLQFSKGYACSVCNPQGIGILENKKLTLIADISAIGFSEEDYS